MSHVTKHIHYIMHDGKSQGECRPAFVVKDWGDGKYNLQVLTDGSNDGSEYADGLFWATSIEEGHKLGEWHFAEDCTSIRKADA